MADEDLVKQARDFYKKARKHQADWRSETVESYDFVAGHQWSQEDKNTLEDEGRPSITFNRMDPYFDAISGQEVNSRQQIQYIPRTLDKAQTTETRTAAVKWVYDECDGSEEESEAFKDVLVCGLGHMETRMDFDDDPDGMIVMSRVDPLEVYVDPDAKKRNLRDEKEKAIVRWLPKKEVEDKWGKDIALPAVNWAEDDDKPEPHQANLAFLYRQNESDYDAKEGKIRVVHYMYVEYEPLYRVMNQESGKLVNLSQKKFDLYKKSALKEPVEKQDYVKLKTKSYKYCFIAGDTVLDKGTYSCKSFPLKTITAKRDRNKNTWYGLARALKDPQMWSNKFFSQILHIINSNAKGGLLAEKGAFVDPAKAERDWADPAAIILLNNGALAGNRIKERQPSAYPQGLDRLMEFAVAALPQVSGVNPEFMGMADREQANVLETQRKKSVFNTLAGLFDSLRLYRKEQGELLLHYINEYISDGRLIRISTDNGDGYIPLDRSDDGIEFDVVVDQAPWSPNLKEQVWESMMQIVPAFAKMGMPLPPSLLDYSPLPTKEVQAWKKKIGDPVPPDVKQQMQQLQEELQAKTMENMQLKAGLMPKMAQIQSKQQLGEQKNAIQAGLVQVEAQNAENDKQANLISMFDSLAKQQLGQDANINDLLKVLADAQKEDHAESI